MTSKTTCFSKGGPIRLRGTAVSGGVLRPSNCFLTLSVGSPMAAGCPHARASWTGLCRLAGLAARKADLQENSRVENLGIASGASSSPSAVSVPLRASFIPKVRRAPVRSPERRPDQGPDTT